ncbi:uncharacterized protein [Nicotiana sylvestris]|uniref:uncharacterized protein n=1 Tax=Nicotiana sylvestris TaxID=4096 RepID=UPI00388CEA52
MPPYLRIYDGTTDPEDHLIHYVIAVKGNDLSKEQVPSVLLKKFNETLTGGALTWYSQLPARSISTFEEMEDKFSTAHAGAKKVEDRVNDIFTIRQTASEGLRDFLARFNRVKMGLPNVSEGMAVATFQNGLNRNGSKATKKNAQQTHEVAPHHIGKDSQRLLHRGEGRRRRSKRPNPATDVSSDRGKERST